MPASVELPSHKQSARMSPSRADRTGCRLNSLGLSAPLVRSTVGCNMKLQAAKVANSGSGVKQVAFATGEGVTRDLCDSGVSRYSGCSTPTDLPGTSAKASVVRSADNAIQNPCSPTAVTDKAPPFAVVGSGGVFVCELSISEVALPEPLNTKDFCSRVECGDLDHWNDEITSKEPLRLVAGGAVPDSFVRVVVASKKSRSIAKGGGEDPCGVTEVEFETALPLTKVFERFELGAAGEIELGLVPTGSHAGLSAIHRYCTPTESHDHDSAAVSPGGHVARVRLSFLVSGRKPDKEQKAVETASWELMETPTRQPKMHCMQVLEDDSPASPTVAVDCSRLLQPSAVGIEPEPLAARPKDLGGVAQHASTEQPAPSLFDLEALRRELRNAGELERLKRSITVPSTVGKQQQDNLRQHAYSTKLKDGRCLQEPPTASPPIRHRPLGAHSGLEDHSAFEVDKHLESLPVEPREEISTAATQNVVISPAGSCEVPSHSRDPGLTAAIRSRDQRIAQLETALERCRQHGVAAGAAVLAAATAAAFQSGSPATPFVLAEEPAVERLQQVDL